MHTMTLKIEDSVIDKVKLFLKSFPKSNIEIIADDTTVIKKGNSDVVAMTEQSANTVEDWKSKSEDAVWK
ncbi:MAG: hypothetical protein DRG24_04050 [Epsilonproteobacteria bacterium]|nr:MAG: hypothetical protein DRG24_04050 [Campylobacterota bacterium]